jgi:hypothetical protein
MRLVAIEPALLADVQRVAVVANGDLVAITVHACTCGISVAQVTLLVALLAHAERVAVVADRKFVLAPCIDRHDRDDEETKDQGCNGR